MKQAGTNTHGELEQVGNSLNPWAYCMQKVHFRNKKITNYNPSKKKKKSSMPQTALWRTLLKNRAEWKSKVRTSSQLPQGGAEILLRSTNTCLAFFFFFVVLSACLKTCYINVFYQLSETVTYLAQLSFTHF